MLKGKQLNLSIAGTRLAHSRGCTVDRKTDTIEVCSPTDGAARRYLPTTTSWAISANGLYANKDGAERLRQIWRDKQLVDISYITDEAVVERGKAILIHLQETGNYNELVKFSIQLQGSGALEKDVERHLVFEGIDINHEFNQIGVQDDGTVGYLHRAVILACDIDTVELPNVNIHIKTSGNYPYVNILETRGITHNDIRNAIRNGDDNFFLNNSVHVIDGEGEYDIQLQGGSEYTILGNGDDLGSIYVEGRYYYQ